MLQQYEPVSLAQLDQEAQAYTSQLSAGLGDLVLRSESTIDGGGSDELDVPPAFFFSPTDTGEVGHAKLDFLEHLIRTKGEIDLDAFTTHHFAPGTYARELRIPAGVILTGKIHRTSHLNIVSAGRILVWSEEHGTRLIEAPFTFVSSPGTRRVGFALEDTVWTTIHPTDETDLVKLEELLIEPHDSSQIPFEEVVHRLATALQLGGVE